MDKPKKQHISKTLEANIRSLFKDTKRSNYSIAVLTFLTVSLFGWYAISPTLKTIIYLKREINDLEQTNIKMEEKINKLIEAQSILSTVDTGKEAVFEAIPNEPQALEISTTMYELSRNFDATISSFQISEHPVVSEDLLEKSNTIDTVDIIPLKISMTLVGRYENILSFLKQLTTFKRSFIIDSYTVFPKKTRAMSTENSLIEYSVSLLSYYRVLK